MASRKTIPIRMALGPSASMITRTECRLTRARWHISEHRLSRAKSSVLPSISPPIKTGKVTITVTIDDSYSEPLEYELNFVVDGKPFIENLSEFYYFIRKSIGHFGAFFVLGCLGTFGFMLVWDKKKWLYSLPINVALGFGVGALTEYIQTLVPGRYGCWSDIWLDFSGYGSATLIMALVIFTIYIISYFKNKKKLV